MPETDRHRHHHHHHRDTATTSAGASAQLPPTPTKPNTKLLNVLIQALIMALIIILFFLFAGFAVILLLHLCPLGGVLHRPCCRRYNHHYLLDSGDSPPGLSSSQLEAIPTAKFRVIPESPMKSSELCAICLENLVDGDWCRELPGCKHVFHRSCVDRWLAKAPGCPVCRRTVGMGNCQGRSWPCK